MFRPLTSPLMLGVHLLAVAAVTAAVLLGLWQYGVWHSAREAEAHSLANAAPVPLAGLMSADSPYPADAVGQPVTFRGTWLPDETLFVRGRMLHGHRGFWVVTPVAVCRATCSTADPAMLVVRGWTPGSADAPAPPTGKVEVTGWLQPAEGGGVPDQNPRDHVLASMRVVDAIPHVKQDLYGAYVIARHTSGTTTAAGTLVPVTPASLPQPSSFTSLRNLLYAFQWWVFGGFAVFLWWRWVSDEVRRVTGREPDGTEVEAAGVDSDGGRSVSNQTGGQSREQREVGSKS